MKNALKMEHMLILCRKQVHDLVWPICYDLIQGYSVNIMSKVDVSSAIRWCKIATKFNLQELKVKAKSIIVAEFYKAFSAHALDLSDMLDLLRDTDLMSVESDLKLKVVIAWVMEHEKERKEGFAELIECIDLDQCSTGYLGYVLEIHQNLLSSQLSVTAQLSKAVVSGLNKGKHLSVGHKFTVIGGLGSRNSLSKTMFKINMNTGTVEEAGEVPDVLCRYHAARCATPSGALFSVSGGITNIFDSTTNDCVLFDLDTMSVTLLQSPP